MSQGSLRWSFGIILILAMGWGLSSPVAAQGLKVPNAPAVQYQFQVLHGFGANGDGVAAGGYLVMDSKGNLYGVTAGGGTYNEGTVYELSPTGNGMWYTYGFRVPLLVVSQYTQNYISGAMINGQPNENPPYVHDFGSILGFVEAAFNLPPYSTNNGANTCGIQYLDDETRWPELSLSVCRLFRGRRSCRLQRDSIGMPAIHMPLSTFRLF